MHLLGTPNEEFGTKIWTFDAGGTTVSLWQEYAILLSLPMSLVGLVVGNALGRTRDPGGAGEAA